MYKQNVSSNKRVPSLPQKIRMRPGGRRLFKVKKSRPVFFWEGIKSKYTICNHRNSLTEEGRKKRGSFLCSQPFAQSSYNKKK